MRALLVILMLACTTLAQGMFDLLEGNWVGQSPAGKRLQLQTGGTSHWFELQYDEHWVVRGEYRVTATKGQPHVSFKPISILEDGQTRRYFELEKWPLRTGSESRAILDYADHKLSLDVFGPEIEFYWRCQLDSIESR